jgi:hypothetical protein
MNGAAAEPPITMTTPNEQQDENDRSQPPPLRVPEKVEELADDPGLLCLKLFGKVALWLRL